MTILELIVLGLDLNGICRGPTMNLAEDLMLFFTLLFIWCLYSSVVLCQCFYSHFPGIGTDTQKTCPKSRRQGLGQRFLQFHEFELGQVYLLLHGRDKLKLLRYSFLMGRQGGSSILHDLWLFSFKMACFFIRGLFGPEDSLITTTTNSVCVSVGSLLFLQSIFICVISFYIQNYPEDIGTILF